MKDNFFSKNSSKVGKRLLECKFVGLGWQFGEPSKKRSRTSRKRPRTLKTYQNKLRKLKSFYNRVFKHSQKAKEAYMALSEADRKPKNKVFFCQTYPDFDKFLAVNKLKPIGKERAESVSRISKPQRKIGVWGN